MSAYLYLAILAFGLCFQYVIISYIFSFFFKSPLPRFGKASLRSVGILGLLVLVVFWLSFRVLEPEFGNRVLHAFGGGFLSFLACFLAVKDHRIPLSRVQFFILSFFAVCALGVANELIEFFAQSTTHLIFAESIVDTWLDLTSNTIGALIAAPILTFIVKPHPSLTQYPELRND